MSDDRFAEDTADDARNQLVAAWLDAGGECPWEDDCAGDGCQGCLRAYSRAQAAPVVTAPDKLATQPSGAAPSPTEDMYPYDPTLTTEQIRALRGNDKFRAFANRDTVRLLLEARLYSVPTPDQRRV